MNTKTAPEGLQAHIVSLLDGMRLAAGDSVASDLQALLQAAQASPASLPQGLPDDAPEWVRFAFPLAVLPNGAVCWGSAKALLTIRTVQLMAEDKTPEGLSGCFLAEEAGIDLYEFASECWAGMLPSAAGPIAEGSR